MSGLGAFNMASHELPVALLPFWRTLEYAYNSVRCLIYATFHKRSIQSIFLTKPMCLTDLDF